MFAMRAPGPLFGETDAPWSRAHIPLLLMASLLTRLPMLGDPAAAVLNWRSADNASIARNYFLNGFHLFFPQVDWGGDGPGFVEMEFPIVQFLTAALYGLFGFDERLTVVFPMLAGLGVVLVTYALGRHLFGPTVGFLGGLVAAVSTSLARFSQAFYGDPVMVLSAVVGIFAFLRWCETERVTWLALSAAGISLAVLIKPTALVLGLPLLYAAWLRFGIRLFARPSVSVFAALIVVPAAAWYAHAFLIGQAYGNTFGVLSGGYLKVSRWDLLFEPEFYAKLGWWAVMYHVTPVAFVAAVIGFLRRPSNRIALVCHLWIVAVVAQALLVPEGNFAALYYQLLAIPPAAILAGSGLEATAKWMQRPREGRTRFSSATALAVLLVLVGLGATFSMYRFRSKADFERFGRSKALQAQVAASVLRPEGLLIYSALNLGSSAPVGRGAHSTPPEFFYFTRHRGWFVAIEWLTVEEIEALRERGAKYFIASDYWHHDLKALATMRADVLSYLTQRYRKLLDRDGVLVFDLASPAQGVEGHEVRKAT
jgi:4-amino-4-deoxy-L-arabinose transferase-like glycosyltransferase